MGQWEFMKNISFLKIGLRARLIILFMLLALFCLCLSSISNYFITSDTTLTIMQTQIKDCASLLSKQINQEELSAIEQPQDKDKAEFKRIQHFLDDNRHITDGISNIYVFRITPDGKIVFIVDESPKDGLESAEIGEEIPDPDGIWLKHARHPDTAKKAHADNFISHDRFGAWLSGFAPIIDKSGNVYAYIGVDIDAKSVKEANLSIIKKGALSVLIILPLVMAFGWILGNRMTTHLLSVRKGLEKIRNMDFSNIAKASRNDEFGELVDSFNATKQKLKETMDSLAEAKETVERKSALLRQFVDAMPYPVFCKDKNGVYLECNNNYCENFIQLPREQIIGNKVSNFMPFINPPLHESMDKIVLSGEHRIVSYESSIQPPEGDLHHFIIYKSAFNAPDGSIAGLVGSVIDITERGRMEKDLRKAKEEADNANFAKSRFLANISHEIRTPLNSMIGAIELLRETATDKDQIDLLDTMEESGKMLVSIIGEILDLAKIESGKMILEEIPCSLNDLVFSIEKAFKLSASKKGISISSSLLSEENAWVYCDPTRLKQIISNLLTNALKFTDSGAIELSIKKTDQRQTSDGPFIYRFSVKDTGIGISFEKMHNIFEAFTQDDISTARLYGGYGLGLSICKHLVTLMGGNIHAESQKGQGSIFYFEIPLKNAYVMNPELPDLTYYSDIVASELKVLIADDHTPSVKITRTILEGFSCKCTEAFSCKDVFSLVEHKHFDLILLDLAMQDGYSFDTVEKIRIYEKNCKRHPSYIVALTANSINDNKEHCLQVGMNDFLLKPITRSMLAGILHKLQKAELIENA